MLTDNIIAPYVCVCMLYVNAWIHHIIIAAKEISSYDHYYVVIKILCCVSYNGRLWLIDAHNNSCIKWMKVPPIVELVLEKIKKMLQQVIFKTFFCAMFQDELGTDTEFILSLPGLPLYPTLELFFLSIVSFPYRLYRCVNSLKMGCFLFRSFVLYRILISLVLSFLYRWLCFHSFIRSLSFFFIRLSLGLVFLSFVRL